MHYTIENVLSPRTHRDELNIACQPPDHLPDQPTLRPATREENDCSGSALIDGLVAGDERALAGAYERYSARVYGLALRVVGDPARAEEVTQDVFVAAWRNRAAFDQGRGSLVAWLLTAARNRTIDLLRSSAARQALEGILPLEIRSPANVEETVLNALDQQAIAAAVEALPRNQRHAIEKAYFGGQSAREIAADLGVPVSTVKGRLRLGLRRLSRDIDLRMATRTAA